MAVQHLVLRPVYKGMIHPLSSRIFDSIPILEYFPLHSHLNHLLVLSCSAVHLQCICTLFKLDG